jgi:hypothetical protein
MNRPARRLAVLLGIILLLFGLLCLNYTKPAALERHRQSALRHSLATPNNSIVWVGASAI